MAVLLPLATLLLGKALSKTKQHKAVCFAARSLPSLLHGADNTCKFSAPPREQKPCEALELQYWRAVGTYLHLSLASGGILGWKLHPRASPTHTKALSHVTDLGHIFKRQLVGCSVQDQAITEQTEINVRINWLETFQVTELEPGVIRGQLINSSSHLRKTEHLTTVQIHSFPVHEAFTPGLSANESDFHHHHLYLTCKLYSAGKTST